jgi:hypothetical protein
VGFEPITQRPRDIRQFMPFLCLLEEIKIQVRRMDLFGIKSEAFGVLVTKYSAIYVYLCCNIIAARNKLRALHY